jgi:hypothetical protein
MLMYKLWMIPIHYKYFLFYTKAAFTTNAYTVYLYTKYQWGAGSCSLGKAGSESSAHRCIFPKICVVGMGGGGKAFSNIL